MTADPGEPLPPDLLVVVADADAEKLLHGVIARGLQRGCLRPHRWALRRNPMRDPAVRLAPLAGSPDAKPGSTRVLVVLDHHGCGRAETPAREVENEVILKLQQAGFGSDAVACVVLEPELEVLLGPAWDLIAALLAKKRAHDPPSRAQVVAAGNLPTETAELGEPTDEAWQELLLSRPKECFDGLLRALRLRHQPALFEEIASRVSLPRLKASPTARRIAAQLEAWFGVLREP